jgi:hypothetical protein
MVNRKRLAKPQAKQPAPLASDGPGNRFLMLQTLMAAPIAHAEADGKDTPLGGLKIWQRSAPVTCIALSTPRIRWKRC